MALYWAMGLGVPRLLAAGYTTSILAVWYIVALVLAFCLGSLIVATREPKRASDYAPRDLHTRRIQQIVLLGTGTGIAATILIARANGYSLTSIVTVQALG